MERHQLEYFVRIAEVGSFTRAAESLHVAQPSISRAIRKLEDELGVALFHRAGRHVTLTGAGDEILDHARIVLRDVEALRAASRGLGRNASGRVDVAATSSSTLKPVADVVARLQHAYPGVQVMIHACSSSMDVLGKIVSGRCEIGISGSLDQPAGREIVSRHLRDSEFLLVAPTDESFGRVDRVLLSALSGRRFVVAEPLTALRTFFDRLTADMQDIVVAAEVGHREAILPMVLKGVGIGVITDAWKDLAERAGATTYGFDPPQQLPQWLTYRRARRSTAAQAFIDMALAESAAPS